MPRRQRYAADAAIRRRHAAAITLTLMPDDATPADVIAPLNI